MMREFEDSSPRQKTLLLNHLGCKNSLKPASVWPAILCAAYTLAQFWFTFRSLFS